MDCLWPSCSGINGRTKLVEALVTIDYAVALVSRDTTDTSVFIEHDGDEVEVSIGPAMKSLREALLMIEKNGRPSLKAFIAPIVTEFATANLVSR